MSCRLAPRLRNRPQTMELVRRACSLPTLPNRPSGASVPIRSVAASGCSSTAIPALENLRWFVNSAA